MTIDYVKKIKKLIADKAGQEPSEIENEMFIQDDLNLGDMELMDILEELEEALHVDLVESKDEIETVNDLIELVEEQVE
jgi:acyl carrier protein